MSLFSMLCGIMGCTAQPKGYESVDVTEFDRIISDADVVRLDVRTADEYSDGHIDGAINIDIQQSDSFDSLATKTLPKDKTIAVYCRSGRRSKVAAERLAGQGFKVVELSNGFNGWTGAGKSVTKDAVDMFLTDNGTIVRTYCIKHGTVRIQIGNKWIYVDPVTKAAQPVTDYSNMPKADIILITHEHGDHLDTQAISQLMKSSTMPITNQRSNAQLGGDGKSVVMKNGDHLTLAAPVRIKLEAVPAYNTGADKQQFHPKGRDNGYIINIPAEAPGKAFRIYIAGDTEDIPELTDIKDIDIAFLPCNLPYTMSPEQLVKAAKTVKPTVLFPYHYGQTDMQQVVKMLDGSGIDVRIRKYQ